MSKASAGFVDPNLLTPHYNTSIYKGYISYLIKRLGEARAREIIAELPISWDYLNSNNNWVSESFSEQFFDVLAAQKDLPEDFSYQAGLHTMSPESLGTLPYLVSKAISTEKLFKEAVKHGRRLNKIDHFGVGIPARGLFSFSVKSNRPTKHSLLIAQNWKGSLEGALKLHSVSGGRVEFQLNSDNETVFAVKWRSGVSKNSSTIYLLLSVALLSELASPFSSPQESIVAKTIPFISIAGAAWLAMRSRRQAVSDREFMESLIEDHEKRYLELYQNKTKLDRRFREANLLRGVISRITQNKTSDGLINRTISELRSSLGYDRVVYFRHNSELNRLEVLEQTGFSEDDWRLISKYSIDLEERTDSGMHLGNLFKTRKNILVPVSSDYINSLSDQGRKLVELSRSKSFLACTVATDHSAFGVILVDYVRDDISLTKDDLHIIENLSNQLAILLDNATILEQETKLRKSFQKFVPTEVINQMMNADESGQSVNVRSGEVTVLFSDIRGFTVRSDHVPADLLVKALNHYLSRMTDIVYRNGGIVDKFLGDGLMAIFNAFGQSLNHSDQAVKAATDMMTELPKINAEISSIVAGKIPWVPFSIGIGVHSGSAIVGNVGSKQKMEFTAVGRAVNIASRLQELTKLHPGILISDQSYKLLSTDFASNNLGMKQIRGIKDPMQVHQIETDLRKERPHARAG